MTTKTYTPTDLAAQLAAAAQEAEALAELERERQLVRDWTAKHRAKIAREQAARGRLMLRGTQTRGLLERAP